MSEHDKPQFPLQCVECSEKRKRKKKSKLSCENGSTVRAEEKKRKKQKKSSKCKDAPAKRTDKKKDKKKKKTKKTVGTEVQPAVSTQASAPGDSLALTTEPLSSSCKGKHPQPDPAAGAAMSKGRKRVTFDLSPAPVRIKRPKPPKPPACSQPGPTESSPSGGAVEPSPTLGADSQSNSQEVNSQDLFITQKTFRDPSPEASSGEATPAQPSGPLLPEHRQAYRCATRPKRGKGEKLDTASCKQKNQEMLTQMSRMGSTPRRKVKSSPSVCKISSLRSPEAEPSVVPPSPRAAMSKKQFYVLSRKTLVSASTQTEDFFTAELSSYCRFRRRCDAEAEAEVLRPLDLTLPHRARGPACTAAAGHGKSGEAGGKSELTPSLQTSTSEDDHEPPGRPGGKLELNQVKAVQTRLNESFFFKTKGNGQSPRPESPLMKLDLGRCVTTRKCR